MASASVFPGAVALDPWPPLGNTWGKSHDSTANQPINGGLGKSFPFHKLPSKSFKDALNGMVSSSMPSISVVHTLFRGLPALMVSDAEILKLAEPFSYALVGKFSFGRPYMEDIRRFMFSLKLSGSFTVGLMDSRHVLINLSNDLDYTRIFLRRSYYVRNFQMKILKWTPDFDVKAESPIIPIWIALPNLRVHFFDSQFLHSIGLLFGRPLQVDQATVNKSRPSVARILVEMDITKNFPNEIWVGSENHGYVQKVVFESWPVFCKFCKTHGHDESECFVAHPILKKRKHDLPPKDFVDPILHKDEVNHVHMVDKVNSDNVVNVNQINSDNVVNVCLTNDHNFSHKVILNNKENDFNNLQIVLYKDFSSIFQDNESPVSFKSPVSNSVDDSFYNSSYKEESDHYIMDGDVDSFQDFQNDFDGAIGKILNKCGYNTECDFPKSPAISIHSLPEEDVVDDLNLPDEGESSNINLILRKPVSLNLVVSDGETFNKNDDYTPIYKKKLNRKKKKYIFHSPMVTRSSMASRAKIFHD